MHRPTGGLGLPNFVFYNWSVNIAKLPYWISVFENKCGPTRAPIETLPNPKVSPISILSSPLPGGTIRHVNSPVVKSSFWIWRQFRKHFNFSSTCAICPWHIAIFFFSFLDKTKSAWERDLNIELNEERDLWRHLEVASLKPLHISVIKQLSPTQLLLVLEFPVRA